VEVGAGFISTVTDPVLKEVHGIWVEQNEGAKFRLKVMNELSYRGVEDILIAAVDGPKGFNPQQLSPFLSCRLRSPRDARIKIPQSAPGGWWGEHPIEVICASSYSVAGANSAKTQNQ